ncbi:hypothetical protein SASPL_113780 [Salvia splendens]|uniref:Uncharacterized protein n=1 Tax=Salvia splendens TaxID=180675 RepID=A0A8X8Y0M4_SALSN|nr:hypothetical protein SASPL_113780 [Salvia splendens]
MPEKLLVCTSIALAMKPRSTEAPRRSRNVQGEGPNWILIAGSALLSTLSVRLGYKLKQVLDTKQLDNSSPSLEGVQCMFLQLIPEDSSYIILEFTLFAVNGKSTNGKKSGSCSMHSNAFCFPQDVCYNHYSGSRNVMEIKPHANGQMMSEPEMALPLVTVPTSDFNKENGVMWSSSPDRLELPQKPFHQSNSSESPCVSESGSDIFSKREVIQKLRQQLKRRDDMILEMQDQIAEVQTSLAAQVSHSSHLQSLLDAANRDLFESEREVQRLRKAIADHCVGHVNSEKGRDGERIEMLRREVSELKELNEGKDYLLQSYKEHNLELAIKIKELQNRLDSQLPNIL